MRLPDPPRGIDSDDSWFADNNGLMIEVKIAAKTMLDGKASFGGIAAQPMRDAGFTKGRGLGRHVLGSNYFHYMQNPGEAGRSLRRTLTISR